MPFKKNDPNINRNGRPEGSTSISLVSILKRELEKIPKGNKKTYAQIFISQLLKKGIVEGDHQSMKMIINYVDGLPKQALDLTSNGEAIIASKETIVLSNNAIKDYLKEHSNENTGDISEQQ